MSRSRRSRSRDAKVALAQWQQSHPDVPTLDNLSEYQLQRANSAQIALMQTQSGDQQAVTQAQDSLTQARQAQLQAQYQLQMSKFTASLPANLLNPQSAADQSALAKAQYNFFMQHKSELSNAIVQQQTQAFSNGHALEYKSAAQLGNTIGLALNMSPSVVRGADGTPNAQVNSLCALSAAHLQVRVAHEREQRHG